MLRMIPTTWAHWKHDMQLFNSISDILVTLVYQSKQPIQWSLKHQMDYSAICDMMSGPRLSSAVGYPNRSLVIHLLSHNQPDGPYDAPEVTGWATSTDILTLQTYKINGWKATYHIISVIEDTQEEAQWTLVMIHLISFFCFMLTGWSCDWPHSIFTLQDSPLAFHMKQGRLTDANDSFVSYIDQAYWWRGLLTTTCFFLRTITWPYCHVIRHIVPPLYPTVDVVFLLYKVKLAGQLVAPGLTSSVLYSTKNPSDCLKEPLPHSSQSFLHKGIVPEEKLLVIRNSEVALCNFYSESKSRTTFSVINLSLVRRTSLLWRNNPLSYHKQLNGPSDAPEITRQATLTDKLMLQIYNLYCWKAAYHTFQWCKILNRKLGGPLIIPQTARWSICCTRSPWKDCFHWYAKVTDV